MISLIYFNLEEIPVLEKLKDGDNIPIQTLIEARKTINPEFFFRNKLLENINDFEFDPFGLRKTRKWELAVSTIVYCLSGQIPTREEILRGRQIIFNMPQSFKKNYVSKGFVLGFLPYILIAMKSHVNENFYSESNSITDIIKVIIRLFESTEPKIISFLCPHRDSSTSLETKNLLLKILPINKAKKCLNIQAAILANSLKTSGNIEWYQQTGSKYSSQMLFPEIFMNYLESGSILDMLEILDSHFSQLQNLYIDRIANSINFQLKPLDNYTKQVKNFIINKFGVNWKSIDYLTLYNKDDTFINIALNLTLPEIYRFMLPKNGDYITRLINNKNVYFNKNIEKINRKFTGSKNNWAKVVFDTIDLFYENILMTPTAKAIYETSFYYLWGMICSKNSNLLPIGIDRDHTRYQHEAWQLGFLQGVKESTLKNTSIIYLRRVKNEIAGGTLSDLSFRQFWR